MTTSPPTLTDREMLIRNRARRQKDALFLHDLAHDEIRDRLDLVNRQFKHAVIVTGHPDLYRDLVPGADIVEDNDTLGLSKSTYDLAIHVMSLHWANDPVGQIIQCRQSLVPDGLFLAICPGGQTLHELRACLAQAEIDMRGGVSPRVLPMADLRDLGGLLQRAGLTLPVVDSVPLRVEYDGLTHLMTDLRAMGESNAQAARDRRFTSRQIFQNADERYRRDFPGKQKAITATFELIALSGWSPHHAQPQPLRPGSATARLSDALRSSEIPLQD